MTNVAMGTGMTCSGSMTAACDQRDVVPVMVGLEPTPRPMCAACRAAAEAMGIPIHEWRLRGPERRRNRFELGGESRGRRASDREQEAVA